MNWLRWTHIPLSILFVLLASYLMEVLPIFAQPGEGQMSADVAITVTPAGFAEPDMPTGLILTDVGANSINATWDVVAGANYYTVRIQRDSYPTSITDGELFYTGNLTTAQASGFDLQGTTYYAAVYASNTYGDSDPAQGFIGGEILILLALIFIPLLLTVAMFITRQIMLGFPCALFWAVLGGYCYTLSTTPWGDWQYYLFFASAFGMTTFTALAAFGLRERRDTLADEEVERGEGGYIDEGRDDKKRDKMDDVFAIKEEPEPSKRTRELRERNKQRRIRWR